MKSLVDRDTLQVCIVKGKKRVWPGKWFRFKEVAKELVYVVNAERYYVRGRNAIII